MCEYDNPDRIEDGRCDVCDAEGVGVLLHHMGTPVLFLCPEHGLHLFSRTARRELAESSGLRSDSFHESPMVRIS